MSLAGSVLSSNISILAFVFLAARLINNRYQSTRRKYPPGPPGKPILGNIFDFNVTAPWHSFITWKEIYGDLVFLQILGTKILVLNSQKAINDLLEKRGNIYSGRPIFTVVGELMNLDKSMAMMQYGPEWRACRKLEHMVLSPTSVRQYHPLQEKFAAMLAKEISEDPENFYDRVRLAAARIVLYITYGLSARIIDREYINEAEDTMNMINESVWPGAYICDFLPFLKHLPSWVPFQQKAIRGRQMIESTVATPYSRAKREIEAGRAGPSLIHDLFSSMSKEELTPEMETRIKWTTGSMFGAGSETTTGTTLVFLIAMALHPEKQRLAQEELERVVGSDRLPQITDKDSLPYINAVIKEVMRWHPMVPLSLARMTAEDDEYEGYFIPKGTIVLPNSWRTAYEPNAKYPPEQFIPERFLDPDCPSVEPAVYAFGYGRRICPGKALADASVFTLATTLLATYNIAQSPDAPLVPEYYEAQLTSGPKRFKCKFTLRSDKALEMVSARAAMEVN